MARVCPVVIAIVLLGCAAPAAAAPQAGAPEPKTAPAEALYRAACVTCHGPDGKGSPRTLVGFDVGLPDFTDCSFASAEADADWFAVIHEGGPVRGLRSPHAGVRERLDAGRDHPGREPRANVLHGTSVAAGRPQPASSHVHRESVSGERSALGDEDHPRP